MWGHEKKKVKENKRKREHERKTWRINAVCLIAVFSVLIIGIMAPKTLFAMMDKRELDTIYVHEADTSYLNEDTQLSMVQKLELMNLREEGNRVSTASSEDVNELYGNVVDQVISQVLAMQQKHILPKLDFSVEDISPNYMMCQSLVNLENMNQYVMIAQISYQISDDYLWLTVDAETGKILEYTVYANMDEQEWDAFFESDIRGYMLENLGINADEFNSNYHYYAYSESKVQTYVMNTDGQLECTYDQGMNQAETDAEDRFPVEISMSLNSGLQSLEGSGW